MNPIMIDMLIKAKQAENNHTAKHQTVSYGGQANDRSGFIHKLAVLLATTGVIVCTVGRVGIIDSLISMEDRHVKQSN